MNNSIKNKRNINFKNILLTGIIFTALFLILRTTYAYLEFNAQNGATGTAGCFNVNYTGQAINNANLEAGNSYQTTKAQTTVKLSKATDCKIYTEASIKIYTNDNITAPISNPQALKYKVVRTSGDGTILSGGEGVITAKGDTTLATVELTETETTYTIYIWIDSTISLGYYDATSYSGYIYAESIQSSTVTQ